jgi:hypothetical protein
VVVFCGIVLYKTDRRVACHYFYAWDQDFGPGFIKLCAYYPYPGNVWVNGHEWAKRQAAEAGINFAALSNGFADCTDPTGLQAICDRLGPGTISVFIERWLARLPLPLDERDREAGCWWQTSMRQIETFRTLVFDTPHRARASFEALIADNRPGYGQPDQGQRKLTSNSNISDTKGPRPKHLCLFATYSYPARRRWVNGRVRSASPDHATRRTIGRSPGWR